MVREESEAQVTDQRTKLAVGNFLRVIHPTARVRLVGETIDEARAEEPIIGTVGEAQAHPDIELQVVQEQVGQAGVEVVLGSATGAGGDFAEGFEKSTPFFGQADTQGHAVEEVGASVEVGGFVFFGEPALTQIVAEG